MKYRNDSEQLAVYTTGTLRPPELLAGQIDHELDLIRTTWGDSIPDVRMKFSPPWNGGITALVSQQLLDQIKTGTNEDWLHLITDLNVRVHFYNFSFNPRYIALVPRENMHPVRLAEHFVAFPGVEYLSVVDILQDWDDYFTRISTSDGARYYFKHCTCPDLWDSYSYFEVNEDSATLRGIHYECWESMVSSPTWVSIERFEELIDSLESSRPAWVDTARQEISRFSNFRGFQWRPN